MAAVFEALHVDFYSVFQAFLLSCAAASTKEKRLTLFDGVSRQGWVSDPGSTVRWDWDRHARAV